MMCYIMPSFQDLYIVHGKLYMIIMSSVPDFLVSDKVPVLNTLP